MTFNLNNFVDSANKFQTAHTNYKNLPNNEEYKEFVAVEKAFGESKSAAKKEAKKTYQVSKEMYLEIQNSLEENSKPQKKLKEWAVKFSKKEMNVSEKSSDYKTDLSQKLSTMQKAYGDIAKCKLFSDNQNAKKEYKQMLMNIFSNDVTPKEIRKTLEEKNVSIGNQANSKIDYFYTKYLDSKK